MISHISRIVLGISGASGMPLAHTLLQHLYDLPQVEVHLIISQGAQRVMQSENTTSVDSFTRLAHTHYAPEDMATGPASGSWQHAGMIICPCSMASLASIAHGMGTNLLHRSADVCLKEKRPLVIVPRETPLSPIHLQNMLSLSQCGATIMPFTPAFYTQQTDMPSAMTHFCGRLLDQLHVEHNLCQRWKNNA